MGFNFDTYNTQTVKIMNYAAITAMQFGQSDVCASEIQADQKLKSSVQYLIADPMSHLRCTLQGDKLLYKNRLILPRQSPYSIASFRTL